MVILDQIQPKRGRIVLHFGRFVRETCCHLLPLFVELNLNRAFVRQFSVFAPPPPRRALHSARVIGVIVRRAG
jgi:hypothetical protein